MMQIRTYTKYNTLLGWLVFILASATYLLTREPTASWWDCGEFLSAAYKLQVVHEPGSPLFLLIGRLFSFLAIKPAQVASAINASSALASGGTILFLFWSITALARKMILSAEADFTPGNIGAVFGAGLVGAMAYAWSDTFWFSAVESEVYALSSFCTALVFWAILKWEAHADEEDATKWLLFISYVMGLSIGVHLLNLLTIPAICYVFYFRKYRPGVKGILITGVLSIIILAGILYGLIPGMIKGAAGLDVLAVNSFHLPFNSGAFFFFLLAAIGLGLAICITQRKKMKVLNTLLLGITFILIGYGSYAMVIIRANANTPLNNSNPDNFISLLGYLGREQYQDSPLVYGQDFTSKVVKVNPGPMRYRKGSEKYDELGPKPEYVYDGATSSFFPRIWDNDHARDYRAWLGLRPDQQPTFSDNLSYFWNYQLNYMYWRYFMWNFAGRQNDAPSSYPNPVKGNWISGLKFADAARLGNQSQLPSSITSNKGYNRLYFLPLILGLLGLFFQFKNDRKAFMVVILLFLFTGIAISIYLNMPPSQPRERDYAFAGSFYAFAIWIGLGVLCIYKFIAYRMDARIAAFSVTLACFIAVPLVMGFQEWDDHDRSTRFTTRDFASNYLNSCAPDAILFTYGDNETYPLWYAQEVEGIRTDIRVINLSLFDASWCIDKCRYPVNRSAPLPISWKPMQYADGTRDYLSLTDKKLKGYTELGEVLDFMGSDDPASKNEDGENYMPTRRFKLSIDPADVLRSGTVNASDRSRIVPAMEWTFNHNSISKGQMIILDILVHNKWKRPVYFCATMGSDSYMGLDNYLQQEGITYRLVPLKKTGKGKATDYAVNRPVMYHHMMDLYHWGNLNGDIHIDDQTNSFAGSFKDLFVQLAADLYAGHRIDSCKKVLDRCLKEIPPLPPLNSQLGDEDFTDLRMAELYYQCNAPEPANKIMERQLRHIKEEVIFAESESRPTFRSSSRETIRDSRALLEEMDRLSKTYRKNAFSKDIHTLEQGESGISPEIR